MGLPGVCLLISRECKWGESCSNLYVNLNEDDTSKNNQQLFEITCSKTLPLDKCQLRESTRKYSLYMSRGPTVRFPPKYVADDVLHRVEETVTHPSNEANEPVSAHFPTTIGQIRELSEKEIVPIEAYYGAPRPVCSAGKLCES